MSNSILSPRWQSRVYRLAIFSCVIFLLLGVGIVFLLHASKVKDANAAKNAALERKTKIVDGVTEHLDRIKPQVQTLVEILAKQIGDGLSDVEIRQQLQVIFDANRDSLHLLEVGVAWEPEYSPNSKRPDKLYGPHYGIKNRIPQLFQIEESYEKDYRESNWYKTSKSEGRWVEPYFGDATQQITAGYAAPFRAPSGENKIGGVVRINFDLLKIKELVDQAITPSNDQVELETGYAMLLSEGNRIISHPVENYAGKNISELSQDDGILSAINELIKESQGEPLEKEITDARTGASYWIFEEHIQAADWTVAVVLNLEESQETGNTIAFYQRLIVVVTVLLICSLLVILLKAYQGTEKSFWYLSASVSVVFSAGIVSIWILAVTGNDRDSEGGVRVFDAASAEAAIRHQLENVDQKDGSLTKPIPTGVFVQSLRFTGANSIVLTGYIWQKSSSKSDFDILPGVIFPEAEEVNLEPASSYSRSSEDGGVKGWYFETSLRQRFNYAKYPFDREDAWIRLWPASFDQKFVLVPDFEAYTNINPKFKPGLENEKEFVIEGWKIQDSYFSYRLNEYNVDFGDPVSAPGRSPELYFNIGLQRSFIDPFVADMTPLLVVAFLVFAVLMISTKHEGKIELLGFSTSAVLGYCAALFFVLIVSHVHLRETLASQGIIYMDYFYFVMYFAILGVSTNSLLFSTSHSSRLIHYRDNLIIKQLYWPILNGSLFTITLLVFW